MASLPWNPSGVGLLGAGHVVDWSLSCRSDVHPGWVLLGALGLAAAAFATYRSTENISKARRYLLTGLRAGFLIALLLLLTRPVLRFTSEGEIRRSLVLLLDGSASMNIADLRGEPQDLKRVALVKDLIDPARGLDQPLDTSQVASLDKVPRLDLVRAAFENSRLNLLPRLEKDYDLRVLQFGRGLAELSSPWLDHLTATADVTPLGDAVQQVLSRTRGQNVAGIVIVTDGASNYGATPLSAADAAREEKVPLFIWGVGVVAPKDIAVPNLFAKELCFINDTVPVTVRVRAEGMNGRSAKLVLTAGNKAGQNVVDQQEVRFQSDAEQEVHLKYTPTEEGDFELTARIEPLADEVVKDNNSSSQWIRVTKDQIKVLYIEQYPRWEFKDLQTVLARDRRIDAHFVLIEGDPGITTGAKSPFLSDIPRDVELKKYDLVILGDVAPQRLQPAQLTALSDYVSKLGGALIVIAGRRSMPWAYHGTALEKMLPVEWGEAPITPASVLGSGAIRLQLTPAGKQSMMLRLSDNETHNSRIWSQMPPVYWTARVGRAKPAAEVLLVDPTPDKAENHAMMPVIAVQQYGVGQVLFVGTDNTWRWRRNEGEKNYIALWGQIVQRMALQHLLGDAKKSPISTDRKNYFTGDRVTVYARLYDNTFQPVLDPTVTAYYSADSRNRTPVTLRALPQQPGLYRGEFVAPAPGAYDLWTARDEKARYRLTVSKPQLESSEVAMKESLLREMATTSRGKFFREEDLTRLPASIEQQPGQVKTTHDVQIWCHPLAFLVLLALVSSEWFVRKKSQLK